MGEMTLRKALDDYKKIHAYRNFAERTNEYAIVRRLVGHKVSRYTLAGFSFKSSLKMISIFGLLII